MADNKENKTEEETAECCGEKEDCCEETADSSAECAEKSETENLKEKISEWENKYYRLAAEYDNYKKRTQREKEVIYTDALIDTAAAVLPVADNLERAMQTNAESEDAKKILEGVSMVMKQLTDVFSKLNIEPIEAVGKEFDPNLHNAVMHTEDDELAENIVAEELMKGYIYKKDRVVRHSMVKVAN